MATRGIYLAKSRRAPSQRAHFAIFIPDKASDRAGLDQYHRAASTAGTVIHVVGEPVMSGYVHDFKRNYNASTDGEFSELIFLGTVDAMQIFESPSTGFTRERTARARASTGRERSDLDHSASMGTRYPGSNRRCGFLQLVQATAMQMDMTGSGPGQKQKMLKMDYGISLESRRPKSCSS